MMMRPLLLLATISLASGFSPALLSKKLLSAATLKRIASSPLNVQGVSPGGDEERSPFVCEVDYVNETAQRKPRSALHWASFQCFESSLNPQKAAEMVLEGAKTMTVSANNMLEALRCLHTAESLKKDKMRMPQGLFRLVFSAGSAAQLLDLDGEGGYTKTPDAGGLPLHLALTDCKKRGKGISLATLKDGFVKLKKTFTGKYKYIEDGAILAYFRYAKLGPLLLGDETAATVLEICRAPFTLRPFFASDDIVVMDCNANGKTGVLVFQKHDGLIISSNNSGAAVETIHTKRPVQTNLVNTDDLVNASMRQRENISMQNNLNHGKANWAEYFNEEIGSLYFVLAAQSLFHHFRHHAPLLEKEVTDAYHMLLSLIQHLHN